MAETHDRMPILYAIGPGACQISPTEPVGWQPEFFNPQPVMWFTRPFIYGVVTGQMRYWSYAFPPGGLFDRPPMRWFGRDLVLKYDGPMGRFAWQTRDEYRNEMFMQKAAWPD